MNSIRDSIRTFGRLLAGIAWAAVAVLILRAIAIVIGG
jgi:hypothetical protein